MGLTSWRSRARGVGVRANAHPSPRCRTRSPAPSVEIVIILNLLNSVKEIGLPLLAENGRGPLLAHQLSGGHCHAYPTTIHTTATPGKAVAFALPTPTGTRLTFPPLPDLRPGLTRLREWTDHHPPAEGRTPAQNR